MDEREQLPNWKVMAAALAVLVSGAANAAPALAAANPPLPGHVQLWDDEDEDEDENDGNDRHPARHDDDDDDDHDDDDDDDLLENLADVVEEVTDLLDDLL